jgi:HAD superfamily hydrolase (TIGR01509 family)
VPAADAAAHGATGRSRQLLFLGLLAGLLAFVVVAALVGAHAGGGLDGRVIAWVEAHEHRSLNTVAVGFDYLGRWWLALSGIVAIAGVLWLAGRRAQARYLALTMALSLSLNLLLKLVFRRMPPGGGTVVKASTYAFPSGHTMTAAALAAALALIAWPTRWRWPVLLVGVAFAGAMGLSRVYLAVHWPSDVAAGWALGIVVAFAVRAAVHQPAAAGAPAGARSALEQPAASAKLKAADSPIEVVFLDWGNTLMADDGSQAGPMATWLRVKEVDGAQDALRRLRLRYRLIVATNADDSDAPDVRAALSRVGLDELIDDVVSSRDVGARKPDPLFYRAALLRAGFAGVPLAPGRAVMVGDSLENDVAGARGAGLRTVWLNPSRARRPAGAAAPDAEIRKLAALPQALAKLSGAAPVAPPRRAG